MTRTNSSGKTPPAPPSRAGRPPLSGSTAAPKKGPPVPSREGRPQLSGTKPPAAPPPSPYGKTPGAVPAGPVHNYGKTPGAVAGQTTKPGGFTSPKPSGHSKPAPGGNKVPAKAAKVLGAPTAPPKPSGRTVGTSADGSWQTSKKAGKVLGTHPAFATKSNQPAARDAIPGKKK